MRKLKLLDYAVLSIIILAVATLIVALLVKGKLDRSTATAATTAASNASISAAVDSAVMQLVLENGKIVHKPVGDFHTFLSETDKPIFVDFWATWCGPCISAAPFVESLADEFDGKAYILKIDVDKSEELAQEYDIVSIPTFFVIKGGKTRDSLSGYADSIQDQIRQMLADQIG